MNRWVYFTLCLSFKMDKRGELMINKKTWSFILEMKRESFYQELFLKQGDILSNELSIDLQDEGLPYNLTGYTLSGYIKRADAVLVPMAVTVADAASGKIKASLPESALLVSGKAKCEIIITGTLGELLGSPLFFINIQPSIGY